MHHAARSPSFRIAIAGVAHGHVKIFQRSPFLASMDLVGVWEADDLLRLAYRDRHDLPEDRMFDDLEIMLDATRPEAVCAFGSIRDHLAVVRAAAPRGIHVMVEKPLAISAEAAGEMAKLARRHGIHLITNYETTWYATTHHLLEAAAANQLGPLHKAVVHDGHRGPEEIGCEPEFIAWLTDVGQSGGGAMVDFGCYGANLMTRLMAGATPRSVTAVARQVKPEAYPGVEDDATILLQYDGVDAVIQASWAWPVARKDLELYGSSGQMVALDGLNLVSRQTAEPQAETREVLKPLAAPLNDPFSYLAGVVRGEIAFADDDLGGLTNNLTVVQILDAARRSASEGRTVTL